MIVKPIEIANDKATGEVYILVHFWANQRRFNARPDKPDLINDFIMQLRPTGEVATEFDAEGRPIAWKTVDRDVLAEAKANVRAFIKRAVASNYRGDMRDPRRARDQNDTRNLLPKLANLKNAVLEETP